MSAGEHCQTGVGSSRQAIGLRLPRADSHRVANLMSVELPSEFVESLADAIAERLELPRASRWLDVAGPADHLAASEDAVRKAAQRRQLPVHQPYGAGSRYLFDRGHGQRDS